MAWCILRFYSYIFRVRDDTSLFNRGTGFRRIGRRPIIGVSVREHNIFDPWRLRWNCSLFAAFSVRLEREVLLDSPRSTSSFCHVVLSTYGLWSSREMFIAKRNKTFEHLFSPETNFLEKRYSGWFRTHQFSKNSKRQLVVSLKFVFRGKNHNFYIIKPEI